MGIGCLLVNASSGLVQQPHLVLLVCHYYGFQLWEHIEVNNCSSYGQSSNASWLSTTAHVEDSELPLFSAQVKLIALV